MYKVMIVDDEPIIVEGLSRSIAWEKWNCKVAATAHDGLEGKRLSRRFTRILCLWISACRRWTDCR